MDASKAAAVGIIPLDQMYLLAIVQTANSARLSAVLQDLGNDAGRLWLTPSESTVPVAQISFKFDIDEVKLGVVSRDERELVRVIRYAEGLDGFLPELSRFLTANLLAAPRAGTAGHSHIAANLARRAR